MAATLSNPLLFRKAYQQGLMQGGEPMDPDAKAKMYTALTGLIGEYNKSIQAFRTGAAEAYTSRFKAKMDAEAALGKALADFSMATAVGAQARGEFAAKVMEAQAKLTANTQFAEGNTSLVNAYITEAKGYGEAASTAASSAQQQAQLQQLVSKNGPAFRVNPDGTFAVNPALDAIIADGVAPLAQAALTRAKTDYDKELLNSSRYGTILNEGAAAATFIGDNYSAGLASILRDEKGQPPDAATLSALSDYVRQKAQDATLATFRADPNFEFGRQQSDKMWEEAKVSAAELDRVRDSLGASTVGRSSVLAEFERVAQSYNETPKDISEGMREMRVPSDLIAGRDFAVDALSRLEQTPQSPFAQALAKLSQNPNFQKFADAYGFDNVVEAGAYIANNPSEYKAAVTVMDTADKAGKSLSTDAVRSFMAEGRSLGENATSKWQRLLDDIVVPNRGEVSPLAVDAGTKPPPSIAEREAALERGMGATAWGKNPQSRGDQPFESSTATQSETAPVEAEETEGMRRARLHRERSEAAAGPGTVDAPRMTKPSIPATQAAPAAASAPGQIRANIESLKTLRAARPELSRVPSPHLAGIFSSDEK